MLNCISKYTELQVEYLKLIEDPLYFEKKGAAARVILNLQNQNFFLKEMAKLNGVREHAEGAIEANEALIISIKNLTKFIK